MSILPGRRLFLEGLGYLILGIICGMLVESALYQAAPEVAPVVSGAAFSVVAAKVGLFERLGLKIFLSIFLANLISCTVIMGYPEAGLRWDRKNSSLYVNIFPRAVLFFIGFISLGLIFPPITNPVGVLAFSLLIIPHGTLEFTAIILAYTVPREYVLDMERPFPLERAYLIVVLLLIAAGLETYLL